VKHNRRPNQKQSNPKAHSIPEVEKETKALAAGAQNSGDNNNGPNNHEEPAVKSFWHEPNHWIAIAAIISAIATGVTTFFIWRQIQGSHLDQRAWVGPIEVLPGDFTIGNKKVLLVPDIPGAKFGVLIANSGKTPALHTTYAINRKYLASKERFIPTYEGADNQAQSVSVIQPNMRMVLTTLPMNRGLTNEEIRQLGSGEEILYVFGHIEYTDVFKQLHTTTFCFSATWDLAGMVTCNEYNDAN
jgi:hypothetical protein